MGFHPYAFSEHFPASLRPSSMKLNTSGFLVAAALTISLALQCSKKSENRYHAAEAEQTNHKTETKGYIQDEATRNEPAKPAAAAKATREEADTLSDGRASGERPTDADAKPAANLGRVFMPAAGNERKLEYNVSLNYQISELKPARAFFNQWIPRYGFLLSETAAGDSHGYMSLRVRIRSANLYAALNDLDQIGRLSSENIAVTDHTENAVYQQFLAAREEIRNRRRSIANAQTGTGSKNWEATENLLSQSEDRQLATRMEDWRINDRVGWATLNITLSLPPVPPVTTVEVPHFRNAFVGVLNVLLQLLYVAIYIVPLIVLGYAVYRLVLRLRTTLRNWSASRSAT